MRGYREAAQPMNPFFDFTREKPRSAQQLALLPQRAGKTALMWHALKRESERLGVPIECVKCERPHEKPPLYGKCPCGSYGFGVRSSQKSQPSLPLEAL